MRKWLKAFAGLYLVGSWVQASGQDFSAALNKWATGFPQEKIFIHYDQDHYVAGETVWFKAYLYSNNAPSGLSNNFYLQLIDQKGRILLTRKYLILGAVVKGDLTIPDTLSAGEYYIRALTPGMVNYGDALLYRKKLLVFKAPLNAIKVTDNLTREIHLEFFPEGGNLVEGLKAVMAFKAADQWGSPVEITGTLRTSDGADITGFTSYHNGMGALEFLPLKGRKYVADLDLNGTTKSFPVPESHSSGINLKVQDEAGGKLFQLARSENQKQDFENIFLVVEMNNTIIYENEIAFEGYPSVQGHLLTDSLPSGILHFTVFNKAGAPIAERLTFVDNGEYKSPVTLNITKAGTAPRAQNNYEINFEGNIQRSCSVAIIDANSMMESNHENIYSGILLTGDLSEPVHNAGWYFTSNDSIKKAMDNLMLTQHWSRFDWSKLLANQYPEIKLRDQKAMDLTGYVNESKDKARVAGGRLGIDLTGEDSITQSLQADIDKDGQFFLKEVSFNGHSRFYYAYADPSNKTAPAKVHFNENEMDKTIKALPFKPVGPRTSLQFANVQGRDDIKLRSQQVQGELIKVKELQRVVLRSSSKKPIDIVNENYATGAFRTMGKVNIDNINDPANDRSLNGVDFVKNRVQQLEIQGGTFVNRKNFSLSSGEKWNVEILINESPSTLSMLRSIRADEIALVKFYEAGFVGVGSGSPGGAVAVYTKKDSPQEPKQDKLDFVFVDGYALARDFPVPDYKDGKKEGADNRSTLYWNPDVYTDNESKSFKVNFYNNDLSKKFRIVVEGFDAAGKLIHLEKTTGN